MHFRYLRKILLPFFLLLFSVETSAATSVIVTVDVLNVRAAPWGKLVGKVYLGQQFPINERKDGWGQLEYEVDRYGWIALEYTKDYAPDAPTVSSTDYCGELNAEFDNLGWSEIRCRPEEWEIAGASTMGRPLFYKEFGTGSSVTIVLCSVHSDESTAYQCFRLNDLIRSSPHLLRNRLVIVPLLNPDGFLQHPHIRLNAHGVDLNRNLPTIDWHEKAIQAWTRQYHSDPRRNPGPEACSEPENRGLLDLIARYAPDKVISIHSPLNFLDLDYLIDPVKNIDQKQVNRKALDLAQTISRGSHFRFLNYNTFPGSLGRYGSEWQIPIYTLELPSAVPEAAMDFFERFKQSLIYSFNVILEDSKTAQNKTTPAPVN